MMNSMAPTSPLQNQDPIYYTSNNYTPPLTNLNKKPYIDENTLQTIPDDKKEELYKKYETFDSQSERIEINNSHNYNNKPSFQSNIPKKNEMNIINDNNNEIYFNDQRVFWFSVDWKKIIKKFNEILK